MNPRPLTVTILAWFFVIGGFCMIPGAWVFWKMEHHPNPHYLEMRQAMEQSIRYSYKLTMAQTVAGAVISFVSGIYLLRGKNWARYLYVAYTVASLVIYFFVSKWKPHVIPTALLDALVLCLLFTPKANRYFSRTHVDQD